jgi:hypothetical protein
MGRGYVSELQKPTGLLLILRWHIWAWTTMMELYRQEKTPIPPPEVSRNPISRVI